MMSQHSPTSGCCRNGGPNHHIPYCWILMSSVTLETMPAGFCLEGMWSHSSTKVEFCTIDTLFSPFVLRFFRVFFQQRKYNGAVYPKVAFRNFLFQNTSVFFINLVSRTVAQCSRCGIVTCFRVATLDLVLSSLASESPQGLTDFRWG